MHPLSLGRMSDNERALLVALIGAVVSILVAGLGVLSAYLSIKRQQRRTTYSEAVRAATAWRELLYRVRRRQLGQEEKIVELFHQAQDNLWYYEAWVGAESRLMGRSYKRLVAAVKAETDSLIQAAWQAPVRPVGSAEPNDTHPAIENCVGAFLKDVRSHLSPRPWRKLAMAWRNRKDV